MSSSEIFDFEYYIYDIGYNPIGDDGFKMILEALADQLHELWICINVLM